MPIAKDLQDIIADVLSPAIAERKTFGRTELERLRRSLTEVARQAGSEERGSVTVRHAFDQLVEGIDAGVANIAGLARHAREQAQPAGGR